MTGIVGAVFGRAAGGGGGGGGGISLSSRSISTPTSAAYSIGSDGYVRDKNAIVETWNPTGNPSSAYQVRATLTSGTIAGTFGSWTSLASTQTWTNNAPASGSMLVEIRDVATGTVRASATVSVTALEGGGGGGGIIP